MTSQGIRLIISLIVLAIALGPLLSKAVRRVAQRKEVALQALVGLGCLALTYWVAAGIDGGRFAGQAEPERFVMVGGILIVGVIGLFLLLSILFLEEGQSTLPVSAILWVSLGVIVIVLLVALGDQMERRFGIYHRRAFVAALGLFILACAALRPWWFWGHPKAVRARALLGDLGTMALYFAVGAGLVWSGVLAPWGPGEARKARFHGRLVSCFALQATVPEVPLGREIAYQQGFETGFVIWLPEMDTIPGKSYTAYDGRWHRLRGDTVLVRLINDDGKVAEVRIAPGAYPRSAMIELRPSEFGGTQQDPLTRSIAVDSASCPVEIG